MKIEIDSQIKHSLRAAQWNGLKAGDSGREMESGLVRLVVTLLQRMQQSLRVPVDQLVEYVMNNAEPWSVPAVVGETPQQQDIERRDWERYLTSQRSNE
jgi:hypothetical protein